MLKRIINTLIDNDYKVWLVGGAVRDILMGKIPHDLDLATTATPSDMHEIFDKVLDTGIKHLTCTILDNGNAYEITTIRKEGDYLDSRHPSKVEIADSIEEDLQRRDFTINAMAIEFYTGKCIDPFDGLNDIKKGIIRCVGDPYDKLSQDKLRALRAVRFYSQFNFELENKEVLNKIDLTYVSNERIRDEFFKILVSPRRGKGIELLIETGLMKYIIPELMNCIGIDGGKHHDETVLEHCINSLNNCLPYDPLVCLAALCHDIGKPMTVENINGDIHFYKHENIGAEIMKKRMRELKFSKSDTNKVVNLIRNHMFDYIVVNKTSKSIKRLVSKIGEENLFNMCVINYADRKGNNKKHTCGFIDYLVKHTIISEWLKIRSDINKFTVNDININGNEICSILNVEPGVIIGDIKNWLLELIVDNEVKNINEDLRKKVGEEYERRV